MGQIATAWHLPDFRSRQICFVTETYPPEINGVALTLARLIAGLAARGHTISLVRPYQRRSDVSRVGHNVTLVRGLPLPGYSGLQFGLPAGRLLRRVWSRSRPHAVYVATEGPLGWSAVRTAQKLGIAAVSGFHTIDTCINNVLYYGPMEDADAAGRKWEAVRTAAPALKPGLSQPCAIRASGRVVPLLQRLFGLTAGYDGAAITLILGLRRPRFFQSAAPPLLRSFCTPQSTDTRFS